MVSAMAKPARILPLSMTVQTTTGQQIVIAATHSAGRDEPPRLLVQGGVWRVELPEGEVDRLRDFIAGWWPAGAG